MLAPFYLHHLFLVPVFK